MSRMSEVNTNRKGEACIRRAVHGETAGVASAPSVAGDIQTLAIDEFSISQLRQFFELLDAWERKSVDKKCDAVPNSTKAKGAAGGAQG